MARHKRLIEKYTGFPLFHTETNAFTFPLTHTFTKDFSGLDNLALDLQFATDKTLTARKGPTPVFTRASSATRVNETGLIETAPENLILQSEAFGTTWTASQLNVTGTPQYLNVAIAPNGTTTADKLIANTSSSTHQFRQTVTLVGGTTYTLSVHFKASEYRYASLQLFGTANGNADWVTLFDIDPSTPATGYFTGFSSRSITSVGDNWFRCTGTFTTTASGTLEIRIGGASGTSVGNNSYIGDNTSGFFIWGTQLEAHPSARTYIPTTTAAVYGARFDHDPITLACRGLLIEESRTNLCLQSNAFSTTQWGNINTACAVSQNEIGVDGLSNSAWTFTDDSAVNAEGRFTTASLTTGVTYSLSIFVKKTTGTPSTYPAIWLARGGVFGGCVINTTAGTATAITVFGAGTIISTTSSVVDFGNFWRVTSFIPVNATGTWEISISPSGNGTGTGVIDGTTTGSAVFWGAQLEAGAFPTSYIPTTNASVVRSADVCSISGANFTSFYNQPEGTLYLDAAPPFESQLAYPLMVNTTGLAQAHYISRSNEFGAGSKRWRAWTLNVGIEATISTAGNITTTNVKAAYAYKLNDNAFAVNNVLVGTDTVVGMPNPTSMRIGGNDGANALNGHIASIRYFRKRLPNAKLQTLTA